MFISSWAGSFGFEITEGRSIYSWQSFGTTAEMFLQCFMISGFMSTRETTDFSAFARE
jgi:hypothetical protein